MRACSFLLLLVLVGCAELSQTTGTVASKPPSDTACEAECNPPNPADSSGNINCSATSACTACKPPGGAPAGSTCGCWLWSRLPIPKNPDPNFDPDWKREGTKPGDKVPKDTARVYSCQCGY
jgi:hypothetical protein